MATQIKAGDCSALLPALRIAARRLAMAVGRRLVRRRIRSTTH
jgi:hypothetical protein